MEGFEEHMEIKESFKAKIKTLPLGERKRAAMLYSLYLQIVEIEQDQHKQHDAIYAEYSGQINKLSQATDEIVEGLRKVTPEEAEAWKEDAEPEFALTDENNTATPLQGFWKEYIINSGLCELKRQRREGR